jgi:hypothetical protein
MFDSFNAGEALVRTSARHRRTIGGNGRYSPTSRLYEFCDPFGVTAAATPSKPATAGQ